MMSVLYFQLVLIAPALSFVLGEVILNVTTTACQRNCIIYDKRQTCPANIYVNGRQISPIQDGFNVVVVDLLSGETSSDYFRWFRNSYVGEREDFIRWFEKVKNGSLVVVALQNMCYYFDQSWYTYLQDSGVILANASVHRHDMAVVVGCKSSCLPNHGGIPFSYFGRDVTEFSTQIPIKLKKVHETVHVQAQKTMIRPNEPPRKIGVILGVIVAIVLLLLLLIILYIRHKRQQHMLLWCIKAEGQTEDVDRFSTKHFEEGETVTQKETPLYEELVMKKSDKCPETVVKSKRTENDHIYEDIKPNVTIANGHGDLQKQSNKTREEENEYYQANDILLTSNHVG